MKRLIQPELLDMLPPDDPRAVRSRRDLRRVNWWMGNHAIMARALRNHLPQLPRQLTELGAGDGDFLLQVVQKLPLRPAAILSQTPTRTLTLLDLQKNVRAETLASFLKLGWPAEVIVTDVFDWTPADGANDIIVANLFLHHFQDERLSELFENISRKAKLFIAIEPRRSALPSLAGKLLWLIGCNDVTRHDAAISIRAGFAGEEISALWPDKKSWQLNERRAGLFSHLFIARRQE